MNTQIIEFLIKTELNAKLITFEISEQREALVLTVPLTSELVTLLDQINNFGMADLVPLDKWGKIEATPTFQKSMVRATRRN